MALRNPGCRQLKSTGGGGGTVLQVLACCKGVGEISDQETLREDPATGQEGLRVLPITFGQTSP